MAHLPWDEQWLWKQQATRKIHNQNNYVSINEVYCLSQAFWGQRWMARPQKELKAAHHVAPPPHHSRSIKLFTVVSLIFIYLRTPCMHWLIHLTLDRGVLDFYGFTVSWTKCIIKLIQNNKWKWVMQNKTLCLKTYMFKGLLSTLWDERESDFCIYTCKKGQKY